MQLFMLEEMCWVVGNLDNSFLTVILTQFICIGYLKFAFSVRCMKQKKGKNSGSLISLLVITVQKAEPFMLSTLDEIKSILQSQGQRSFAGQQIR